MDNWRKNMKKYIAMILSVIMSISAFSLLCFAEEPALSDIAGTKYQTSAELLYDLGIIAGYDDGTFKPEREVSRGELCAIIARVLGVDNINTAYSGRFTDIENSPYCSYIETLAGMNIVNGVGGDRFEPDAQVLTEQVIKIVVCAINYDKLQNDLTYPDSYISIATQRGLLQNVSSAYGSNMTRGEIAILVENMLEADAVEITYGANGGIEFTVTTVMHELLDIDRFSGIMTANENANLLGDRLPGRGIVTITTSSGNVTADSGVLNINDNLGKRGYYYIRNAGDSEAEVVHFRENESQNDTIDISADDFDRAEISNYGEDIRIYYLENNRQRSVDLNTGS